jgi:NADH:ubiquinone oxidoreductase subunit K
MRRHPDAILQQHAERGGLMIYFSIALLVVAVVLAVLRVAERRSENRRLPATIIVAVLALAVGISSIVQLYRVGDTGAQSVWGNEITYLKQVAGKLESRRWFTTIMRDSMDALCATSCRCLLSVVPATSWPGSAASRAGRVDWRSGDPASR